VGTRKHGPARGAGDGPGGGGDRGEAPAADQPTAGAGGEPSGILYVVATPIGNLADVTLRALETLRAVPLVAAEDTRVTRRLFARHGIEARLVSYREANAAAVTPGLLDHLRAGDDLALVTDAGTPLVSDPGAGLVAAWTAEGGRAVPIPGPSAVLAAVSVAGVVGGRWSFEGFLPRTGRERRERIARIATDPRATILFEAPPRLAATLRDLAVACGDGRPGAVCRELTKIHETVTRDTLGRLRDAAAEGAIPARGEIVLVVGDAPAPAGSPSAATAADVADPAARDSATTLAAARDEVERLVSAGSARGEAARAVAARTGIPRRALYGAADGRARERGGR
jgi:16S rRNA (cytidine1402-2'-O)-methyltransferase